MLSILAPRRRVDQALYAVIMEASNRLLIDSTDSLQEIKARITSRDFEAVDHPGRLALAAELRPLLHQPAVQTAQPLLAVVPQLTVSTARPPGWA